MRIVICDDMLDQLEIISGMVKEYIRNHNLDVEIRTFSHPDKLLQYCENENSQLYILDMVMPMMNGIQLGKAIRANDCEAQIIYATSESEFALESFRVNPLDYLVKPINKERLFRTLHLAISKMKADEVSITIKTKEGLRTFLIYNIICCEYNNHTVKYILSNGESIKTTTIKGSFAEHITPILSDERFIQPHSSFVVNMSRVERLSREGFEMRGGAFVPISSKLFSKVKNDYIDFRFKEEVVLC